MRSSPSEQNVKYSHLPLLSVPKGSGRKTIKATGILTYVFLLAGWNSLAASYAARRIPDWLTNRQLNQLLSFQLALLFFSFKCFQWFNLTHIFNACKSKLLLPVEGSNFCSLYICNCKRSRPGQISLLSRLALPEQDSIMQSSYFTTTVHLIFKRKISNTINKLNI